MTNELLDVLRPDGELAGFSKLRSVLHHTGEWHASVHVWIYDGKRFLMHKRSSSKKCMPGCFDAAVAGHMATGESCSAAAVREACEGLNIQLCRNELSYLGTCRLCIADPDTGYISNEFNHIYLCWIDRENCMIQPDPREVQSLHWMDHESLREYLQDNPEQFCIQLPEFFMVEQYLKLNERRR